MGPVIVVKLLKTDTTHDLSQKAREDEEKGRNRAFSRLLILVRTDESWRVCSIGFRGGKHWVLGVDFQVELAVP